MIAIAAPCNALPRKPQVTDLAQKTYVDAVREFLRAKEIDQSKVKIDNIIRVDFDGDGEEEVLISATNYFTNDCVVGGIARCRLQIKEMPRSASTSVCDD